MLTGLMMQQPLLLKSIAEFGERHHPDVEIVSVTHDNPLHRYTFADAFRRTRQLANALKRLGCQPGDRIGTLAWSDYRHFEAYYAISCSGMVCHTINPRLFEEQIRYIVNHAEDRYLLIDPLFVPLIERVLLDCPSVLGVVVMTDSEHMPESGIEKIYCYEDLIADETDSFDWPDFDENTASALCYTSGTTGDPKGVLYSHRSTVLHAFGISLPDAISLSANDCILPVVPMFHVNAWGIPYAAVITGTKLVLPGPKMSDGEILSTLMNGEGVTVSAGVPTIWLALFNYLEEHDKELVTLDRLVVGDAACPATLIEQFKVKYGVTVLHAWGMTEASQLGLFNRSLPLQETLPADEQLRLRARQGRSVFGVEIKIVDDDNNELSWDGKTSGLLKIRGPWICSNYYGMADGQSEAHDADGWFATGDIANIDPKGFVQLTDRANDVIKSGGEWISSIELENLVMEHPEVVEAAVIGIEHSKWSERSLLIVVPKDGAELTEEEILTWLDGKIASWWKPHAVEFIESLPHTATGKFNKLVLREIFNDYRFANDC